MKRLIFIVIISAFLAQHCYADYIPDAMYTETEITKAKDTLPHEIRELLEIYNIRNGQGIEESVDALKTYCVGVIQSAIHDLLQPIVSILAMIILCNFLEPLFNGKHYVLHLFSCIEILYISLSNSKAFFTEAVSAVHSLYDFSTVLLPCLAATSVAAGATVSAGVKYTASALFMNLLLNFSNTVLIPLLSIYLMAVIGSCMFDQKLLSSLAEFIHWGCKSILTISTIAFTTYLNIAGLISGASDMFAMRITKTAISSVLPVVGNIISGASTTLIAGAAILRNSIGVFGLLSVIGILIVPFIHLSLSYFEYVLMYHLSNFFPSCRFSKLIQGVASAYGMLLGVIGTGFIMIFMTFISFMQVLGG